MVILIDGAAYGAEAVVAVGQGVGNGKFLHAGGSGLLDDAHIGDVVGQHGIKFNFQIFRVVAGVVGLQNVPGHGPPAALRRGDGGVGTGDAVREKYAVVV